MTLVDGHIPDSTTKLEVVKRTDVVALDVFSSESTPDARRICSRNLERMPWSEGYSKPPTGGTQTALVPIMFIAQFFGLFPVSGKLQGDYRLLRFSACSFHSLYSIAVIISSCYLSTVPFTDVWFSFEMNYSDLGREIVFNLVSVGYMICFYRLAIKWKDIMKIWSDFDLKMRRFRPVNFTRRMALFAATYTTTALCEHFLSYFYAPKAVGSEPPRKDRFPWRPFARNRMAGYEGWREWKRVMNRPHQFINIYKTVSWNFTDMFISSISIALSSRFEQFNNELARSSKNKRHGIPYWKTMRETYNHLALFTKFLDKHLSMLVILSFLNNLFFVCFQLLNSLVRMGPRRKIYFLVSFSHILFRTCSVCLSAASIYEKSKKPIKLLFMVPSETYNVEVHRLLLQVLLDRQALSGFNFFYITKGLLLTVAGTILTYEIFLVQLDNLKDVDA